MATRTISNAGGNWNSTATWVEGIVPTSADDIVSTATSGNAVVNVSSTIRSANLSNYTATLTITSQLIINTGATVLTNIFGASMSFAGAGTSALIFQGSNKTIQQNTTSRIPYLQIQGSTTTLSTDMFCNIFQTAIAAVVINGNRIRVFGNFRSSSETYVLTRPFPTGTTVFSLEGTGIIPGTYCGTTIEITGTYSTSGYALALGDGARLVVPSSSNIVADQFSITAHLEPTRVATKLIKIDCEKKLQSLRLITTDCVSGGQTMTIELEKNFETDIMTTYTVNRDSTTDNFAPIYRFTGLGLSASTLLLSPTTSASSANSTQRYVCPQIGLNSDTTHTVGKALLIGGFTSSSTISSITASSTTSINLISKTASQISNYDFTDVNAVGEEIVAINGTLLRTTNVTNVYPTGGGGTGSAGGNFVFFS